MDRRLERIAASLSRLTSRRVLLSGSASAAAVGLIGPATGAAGDRTSRGRAATGGRMATARTFLPVAQVPDAAALPPALQGVDLDPESGFTARLGGFAPTFVPATGLLGPTGDPSRLLDAPQTLGMIVSCLGEVWWVESEPAGGQALRMTVWGSEPATGKPEVVMTGVGGVPSEGGGVSLTLGVPDGGRAGRHGQMQADLVSEPDGTYTGTLRGSYKHGKGCATGCRDHCHNKPPGKKHKCRRNCHRHCNEAATERAGQRRARLGPAGAPRRTGP